MEPKKKEKEKKRVGSFFTYQFLESLHKFVIELWLEFFWFDPFFSLALFLSFLLRLHIDDHSETNRRTRLLSVSVTKTLKLKKKKKLKTETVRL